MKSQNRSEAVTRGIRVVVTSAYVPERSSPGQSSYFFVYHVTMINESEEPVRLQTRHWVITNGEGRVQEVRGPGVVGKTPRLLPEERFEYTSACPLDTPVGSMHGSYQVERDDGTEFDVAIAPFTLSMPYAIN